MKPEVKSVVDKSGFRWNNLTNTSTGTRILVMSVKRAEDIPCEHETNLGYFDEALMVKIGSLVHMS